MRTTLNRYLLPLAVLVAGAIVAFVVAWAVFYRVGTYDAPPLVSLDYTAQPAYPKSGPQPWLPLPSAESSGVVVFDAGHANDTSAPELATFTSLVTDRGYSAEFLGDFRLLAAGDRSSLLAARLRVADALVVPVPRTAYSAEEINLVEQFVRKGGRLILISDPNRNTRINTLAARFGVQFQPDYLYNQIENDRNFQHVVVRQFQPDELTSGLDTIALYAPGSIRSAGAPVAYADANTRSSLTDEPGALYPMAWGSSKDVLALADLTFMIPPYDDTGDNQRLLSNMADFLTTGSRTFDLADFPHFFRSGSGGSAQIILGRPELLSIGSGLRDSLAEASVAAELQGAEDVSADMVFLGLHEDASQVAQYLQAAGVRVDTGIGLPFGTELEFEKTAVTVLDREGDRYVLIVLADTPEVLEKAVERLSSGAFRSDLVTDRVGVSITP